MPTGCSPVYYPGQSKPPCELALDDSYFRIKLHDTQVFFEASWLIKPSFLVFSSQVESSFQPGSPTCSLHRVATLQKSTPCHLGLSTNLTDWLPVRKGDDLRVSFQYVVAQDAPIRNLLTHMEQADLVAKLSLARPDWAVAVKVSKVVGQLLSHFLQEGSQREIFSLAIDLNLANLRAGYHTVIGSHTDKVWPRSLRVDINGNLKDVEGGPLSNISYAVIEVMGLKRRGDEIARNEPWWELLQTAKETLLDAEPANQLEQRQLIEDWRSSLVKVRKLARKQREYLLEEISDMVRKAQAEVNKKFEPKTSNEASGSDELPNDWQDLLGVSTMHALKQSVRDYQDALEFSRQLLGTYDSLIN